MFSVEIYKHGVWVELVNNRNESERFHNAATARMEAMRIKKLFRVETPVRFKDLSTNRTFTV